MRKELYTDYVRHALRYYIRTEKPYFRTKADFENWIASETALNDCSTFERKILRALYSRNNPLPCAVEQCAARYSISADRVWRMMTRLERNVARHRGLI